MSAKFLFSSASSRQIFGYFLLSIFFASGFLQGCGASAKTGNPGAEIPLPKGSGKTDKDIPLPKGWEETSGPIPSSMEERLARMEKILSGADFQPGDLEQMKKMVEQNSKDLKFLLSEMLRLSQALEDFRKSGATVIEIPDTDPVKVGEKNQGPDKLFPLTNNELDTQIQKWLELADKEPAKAREQSADILAKGAEALPSLMRALYDKRSSARLELASAQLALQEGATETLIKGLGEDSIRLEVLGIIGLRGDRKALPALEQVMFGAEDNDFRLKCAVALARLGNVQGMDTLIGFLDSPEKAHRYEAIGVLTEIAGTDHKYRAHHSAEERKEAVQRWRDWLREKRK